MSNKHKPPAMSLSEALSETEQQTKPKGPGLFKLQEVIDRLDLDNDSASEVFFELLYDKNYPARRLWLALNKMGISCHYNSVLKWRELHTSHKLIFPNGKVSLGTRSSGVPS